MVKFPGDFTSQIIIIGVVKKPTNFFCLYIGILWSYTYEGHTIMFYDFFHITHLSFLYQHIQVNLLHFNVFMLFHYMTLKIICLFYWWIFGCLKFSTIKTNPIINILGYVFFVLEKHIFLLTYLRFFCVREHIFLLTYLR